MINDEIEKRLRKYFAGIGRNQGVSIIKSGGMQDHMHLLITLPGTKSLSKIVQLLKGSSSKWINDTFYPIDREFQWQGGYSAFSVSQSNLNHVKLYIENQKEHHRNYSFDEEKEKFIVKHDLKNE
jgi:REP element-mobilizing transposase RayT